MPAPSVTIALDREHRVVFNLATLMRIEEGTSLSLDNLVAALNPKTVGADGQARGVRLSTMARFIAACLDTTPDELANILPLDRTLDVFVQLAQPFAEALAQFTAGDDESASAEGGGGTTRPTAAVSGDSEPGPASISA